MNGTQNRMSTLSDLKNAIRRGDTELVREIANELNDENINITVALDLARNLNRTKGKRGMWDDIVEILEDYFN
jgi:hypothetical protein